MTRRTLAIAAITCLAGSAQAAPSRLSARAVALEALAAKADLPTAPPLLPSTLTDRRASSGDGDAAAREDEGRQDDLHGKAAKEARGQAAREARSEAARAHAAAANTEAARAAAAASKDARGAVEKKNADKIRKKPKPSRPPHPSRGGGN